jgi:hypothetical protein
MRMRWAMHVARNVEEKKAYDFGRTTEEQITFRRPKYRWKDKIRMYFKKQNTSGWTGFFWLRTGTSGGPL